MGGSADCDACAHAQRSRILWLVMLASALDYAAVGMMRTLLPFYAQKCARARGCHARDL